MYILGTAVGLVSRASQEVLGRALLQQKACETDGSAPGASELQNRGQNACFARTHPPLIPGTSFGSLGTLLFSFGGQLFESNYFNLLKN